MTDYLLNFAHPDGAAKARYFSAQGFRGDAADLLLAALFDHPVRNEVAYEVSSAWGTKYVVRCEMESPNGNNPCICSVWIIETDGVPRLVTAYPV